MFMDKLGIPAFGAILNPRVGLSFAEDAGAGGDGNSDKGNKDAGGDGGGVATAWLDDIELDDSIKKHPSLSNFKSVADVVKSYVSVQPLIGKEKLPLPGPNAKKEDWDQVFERLGRPKDVTGYKLPEVKLPEGFPAQDEKVKEFLSVAHSFNLLPNQVAGIFEWYMKSNGVEYNNFLQSRKNASAETETALRKEWGKAYEEKINLAKRTFNSFADENAKQLFEEGLGNDPRIIKLFASIGSKMSEDGLGEGKHVGFLLSPEEALAEIAKTQGDKKHPYFDKLHPEHDIAVKRMNDLFEMAYPEKA